MANPTPLSGCYTALVTPMRPAGTLDKEGFRQLVSFQAEAGIRGIVAVGTTGESPTLSWAEHLAVVDRCREWAPDSVTVVAGAGSNSTEEALNATTHAWEAGITHALLVDPYYNGPSSLEIRREYYEPIARACPDMGIVPYVIPGRTGTRLEPADVALLRASCGNVVAVKDAVGSDAYSRELRRMAGPDLAIMSGDDARTATLIQDSSIAAQGAISVLSNLFPRTMHRHVEALRAASSIPEPLARRVQALEPLLSLVTVETVRETAPGPVRTKARNPVPIKAMMALLGMPAGPCRRPLGRLTPEALDILLGSLRAAYVACPELFDEIEAGFDVSVDERLEAPRSGDGLAYAD